MTQGRTSQPAAFTPGNNDRARRAEVLAGPSASTMQTADTKSFDHPGGGRLTCSPFPTLRNAVSALLTQAEGVGRSARHRPSAAGATADFGVRRMATCGYMPAPLPLMCWMSATLACRKMG